MGNEDNDFDSDGTHTSLPAIIERATGSPL